MTIDDEKHCIRSAIDEELCENCNLYSQTGEDHCYKDAMRMALQLIEELQAHREAWEKVRAEIDQQYDRIRPYNIHCAEGLEMALDIIDKYRPKEGDSE